MFDNIGSKIKGMAQVFTILGIIVSIICGAVLIESGGILIIILGCVISWLSSLTMYGFGHLIEQVDKIASSVQPTQNVESKKSNNESINTPQKERKINYSCEKITGTNKESHGRCFICFDFDVDTEYCKIKNEMGTRELHICKHCKEQFEANAQN